jgi:hypothetical protein
MPTRQDHLAKAEHNEALSRRLEGTRYADWAVTSLFYSALHLVNPRGFASYSSTAATRALGMTQWSCAAETAAHPHRSRTMSGRPGRRVRLGLTLRQERSRSSVLQAPVW